MSVITKIEEDTRYVEEDMPESQSQINLSDYLKFVLNYLYISWGWFITGNLAIYPPHNNYPFSNIAPDVALFKGIRLSQAEQAALTSWQMSQPGRPAPTVVFEISSNDTWRRDLDPKPYHYQLLGVREYFAYDPQRLWTGTNLQLRGWCYADGGMQEIGWDEGQGGLWSEELASWLKPDGAYLRLYDAQGQLRLTGEEAFQRQADADRAALQALLEKLRKNNIDPNNL